MLIPDCSARNSIQDKLAKHRNISYYCHYLTLTYSALPGSCSNNLDSAILYQTLNQINIWEFASDLSFSSQFEVLSKLSSWIIISWVAKKLQILKNVTTIKLHKYGSMNLYNSETISSMFCNGDCFSSSYLSSCTLVTCAPAKPFIMYSGNLYSVHQPAMYQHLPLSMYSLVTCTPASHGPALTFHYVLW